MLVAYARDLTRRAQAVVLEALADGRLMVTAALSLAVACAELGGETRELRDRMGDGRQLQNSPHRGSDPDGRAELHLASGAIFHSDRGSNYISAQFAATLESLGIRHSSRADGALFR